MLKFNSIQLILKIDNDYHRITKNIIKAEMKHKALLVTI